MDSPDNIYLFAYLKVKRKPCVSPPCDARKIVAFVIRAIDRHQKVAYLAAKRRRPENRLFTDIARQANFVNVACGFGVKPFANEQRKHKFAFAPNQLVITSKLAKKRHFIALFKAAAKALADSYGDKVTFA